MFLQLAIRRRPDFVFGLGLAFCATHEDTRTTDTGGTGWLQSVTERFAEPVERELQSLDHELSAAANYADWGAENGFLLVGKPAIRDSRKVHRALIPGHESVLNYRTGGRYGLGPH